MILKVIGIKLFLTRKKSSHCVIFPPITHFCLTEARPHNDLVKHGRNSHSYAHLDLNS